jgi:hypothetical protein
MDIAFVSKVSILIALYLLTNYIYNKTDWHTSGLRDWQRPYTKKINNFLNKTFHKSLDDLLIFIYVIFWGLPSFLSLVLLGYIILFEGTLKFLDSRNYWEQIIICFGFIALYFVIRVYLDEEKIKKSQKDLIIDKQRKTIIELEQKIRMIEKK